MRRLIEACKEAGFPFIRLVSGRTRTEFSAVFSDDNFSKLSDLRSAKQSLEDSILKKHGVNPADLPMRPHPDGQSITVELARPLDVEIRINPAGKIEFVNRKTAKPFQLEDFQLHARYRGPVR